MIISISNIGLGCKLVDITLNNKLFEFSKHKENIQTFEFVKQISEQFIILKQLTAHLIFVFFMLSLKINRNKHNICTDGQNISYHFATKFLYALDKN